MNRLSILTFSAAIALVQFALSPPAAAQFGGYSSGGLGGLLSGASPSETPSAGSGGSAMSAAPTVHKNADRKFHFTIPAGWALISGSPNSDSVVFRKGMTSRHFQFHYTAMAPDFPAEASVKASLTSANQDIKLGKNMAAKRRDDKCESNPKNTCARGWELIDSGNAGPQRIIWQVYDKANTYMNFMASAEKDEFPAARAELQAIIDSIKFE